ncbi:MAG TPA: C2H2-type zinc finger protein [Actinomycetes bacterium]|jgi:hypothetical protein|nr:C2H2-type zinc finger protein [Actinomycetes bacterium]
MPVFQCHKCELVFATQNELNWHLREDHRVTAEPTLQPKAPEPSEQASAQATPAGADEEGPSTAKRARWWSPWRRSP